MIKYFTISILSFCLPFMLMAQDYLVTDYGAIGDGKTLNTINLQKTIDKVAVSGGGRLIIPKGRFLTGSLVLKSNVELHLQKNAVLLGSTNPNDYLKINRWKGLIMGDGLNNISISGKGEIDGQGATLALHIDSLFYAGKIDSSDYNFVEKRPKYYLRPQLIEFVKCKNVKLTGVTLKNAACWVQTYDLCTKVIIENIRVESDAYWNNDGIDIIDCKNVRITNCYINSADDGICIKSSIANNREDGVYHGSNFNDSIYVADCVIRSSASAIKLGARSVGGFKNITIKNIKIFDTFRSAIALESVDGGFMENIRIENIKAKNTGNALFIRLGHRINNREVGSLKNVVIKKICVQIAFTKPDRNYEIRGPELPFFHNVFPASITGIPEMKIENLTLEDITITYPGRGNKAYANMPLSRLKDVPEQINQYPEFSMFGELPAWGLYVRHMKGLTMNNIKLKIKQPDYRPAMVFDDVNILKVDNCEVSGDKKKKHVHYENVTFK